MTSRLFAGFSMPFSWSILPVIVLVSSLSAVWGIDTIRLTDVTQQTGIDFRHTDGSSGKYYVVETVSAGLALFDYDNDGDVDIYFLNGAPLRGSRFDKPPTNAMYRNDGNWKFTDVTQATSLGDTGYGLGVHLPEQLWAQCAVSKQW
ncbi:MAG: FG-GAP repeat domain-containing protein [Planctomycetota bacterium]